jgi:hypothetical protein
VHQIQCFCASVAIQKAATETQKHEFFFKIQTGALPQNLFRQDMNFFPLFCLYA